MIWDVVKAAVNQPKERIGGQMLTYLWCNDGHGKPRHENITSFKSGGIFASRFTKCQCSSHGEHSPWRLSGNCCTTMSQRMGAQMGGVDPQGLEVGASQVVQGTAGEGTDRRDQ